MAFFLLVVDRPAFRLTKAVQGAKHQIDAFDLAEAADLADEIILRHYPKAERAVMRLFDQKGLCSTRQGEREWDLNQLVFEHR